MISLRAGDVVLLDFRGAVGVKRRPALILSSGMYHSARPDLIAGIITSQTSAATGPTDYLLQDWAAAGLHKPSAFRAYLVTAARSDVIALVGHLSDRDWRAIQECVRAALDI